MHSGVPEPPHELELVSHRGIHAFKRTRPQEIIETSVVVVTDSSIASDEILEFDPLGEKYAQSLGLIYICRILR